MAIRQLFAAALLLQCLSLSLSWAPKKAPLMTTFADEVSPDNAWPQYPRPHMERDVWSNLNGLWDLDIKTSDSQGLRTESTQILVPYPVESALSGVMKRITEKDTMVYTRKFTVPSSWNNSQILLNFEAVDWEANVTVNGILAATHKGGYQRFSADITKAVKSGQENDLSVSVWDPTDNSFIPRGKQVQNPNGIMYTATSGIWQTVWLEAVPQGNYIKHLRLVPSLSEKSVTFTVNSNLQIDEQVKVFIKNEEGEELWGNGQTTIPFTLKLPDNVPFKPWSPDNPHLYKIRISIPSSGDSVRSYFGMRELTKGQDKKGIVRYVLNGEPIFLAGPLDQGFWPDGLYTPPNEAAILFDLVNLKNFFGFNMIRKHVKVEPERWYYWCDVLGIIVLQDMPSGDKGTGPDNKDIDRTDESAQNYYREWQEIIQSKWNHPSICVWIPFNEGWGQFNTSEVVQLTKTIDPNRLVNSASGWVDRVVGDVIDMHIYLGPDPSGNAFEHRADRIAQLGEFGGLGLNVVDHAWDPAKSFSYKMYNTKEEASDDYNKIWRRLIDISVDPTIGFSSGVYTQVSDAENEANGLFTYDRKFIKIQPEFSPTELAKQKWAEL